MTFIELNSPASGIGTAIPAANLAPRKTFVVSGSYSGDVIIEGTHDGLSWFIILKADSPSGQPQFIPANVIASQMRVRRTGVGGSLNVFVGAETVSNQAFSAIAVSQIVAGAGVDTSSFPASKTLAVANSFTGEVVFEGKQDGSGWNVITQLQAGEYKTFANLAYSQIRARTTTSVTGTPLASVGAADNFATTPAGIADWDLTLVRYYFIDNDNGDDGNIGYIDAAAGTVFAAGAGDAVALKTSEELRNRLPRIGAQRMVVVLYKPRSDEGNYQNKAGTDDYLDLGYLNYRHISFRGSNAFINDAEDKTELGGVTAFAGPNADDSWTVDSYNTSTAQLTVAAGVLPADGTIQGYKIRYTGNVTSGIADDGDMVTDRVDDTNLNATGFVTPANGDTFFLHKPGVAFAAIRGRPGANGFTDTLLSPGRDILVIAGFNFTNTSPLTYGIGVGSALHANFLQFGAQLNLGGTLGVRRAYTSETASSSAVNCGIRINNAIGGFSGFASDGGAIEDLECIAVIGGTRIILSDFAKSKKTNVSILGASFVGSNELRLQNCGIPSSLDTTFGFSSLLLGGDSTGQRPLRVRSAIRIENTSVVVGNVSFASGGNGIDLTQGGGSAVAIAGAIVGSVTGNLINVTATYKNRIRVPAASTISATVGGSFIAMAGGLTKARADLVGQEYIDQNGNVVFDNLFTTKKLTAGTVGNYPVLAADPGSPADGDVWIKDTGGVRTLNARIGGVTYATVLS